MLLDGNEYSLQTISDKTNISTTNLENLANKNWERLKRTQVHGFIQIIEREFNVDLSDLKAEADNYYGTHKEVLPERPIDLVDIADSSEGRGKIISNLVALVSIVAIGYAGWYYFAKDSSNNGVGTISTNTSTLQNNKGMFDDTINSVKGLLGSKKDKPGAQASQEQNSSKGIESKDTNSSKTVKEESVTVAKSENANKFDITAAQNSEPKSEGSEKTEENKSIRNEVNKLVGEEKPDNSSNTQNQNEALNLNEDKNATVAENPASETKEQNSSSENSAAEEANSSLTAENENNTSATAEDKPANIEQNTTDAANAAVTTATVNLKAKRLWIGVYNLNTHKKLMKTIKAPLTLKVGEDTLAVVTGHNKFSINENGQEQSFTGKGRTHKVYLLISKDGIKEINKKEYRKITKRRAW